MIVDSGISLLYKSMNIIIKLNASNISNAVEVGISLFQQFFLSAFLVARFWIFIAFSAVCCSCALISAFRFLLSFAFFLSTLLMFFFFIFVFHIFFN